MDPAETLSEAFTASMKYGRTTERLRGVLVALQAVTVTLKDVTDLEPDLGPEVGATLEHVVEAVDSIGRASAFLDARIDATMKRLAGQ
jgi:hypothetical protein